MNKQVMMKTKKNTNYKEIVEHLGGENERLKEALEKCLQELDDKESIIANAIEGIEKDSFYLKGNSWVVSKDDVIAYLV